MYAGGINGADYEQIGVPAGWSGSVRIKIEIDHYKSDVGDNDSNACLENA